VEAEKVAVAVAAAAAADIAAVEKALIQLLSVFTRSNGPVFMMVLFSGDMYVMYV